MVFTIAGHDENNHDVNYSGLNAVSYCLSQAGKYALAGAVFLPLAIANGIKKVTNVRNPAESKLKGLTLS